MKVTYWILGKKKTKNYEYLPLSQTALQILKNNESNIINLNNGQIFKLPTNQVICYHLNNWSVKAGIKKHISFHGPHPGTVEANLGKKETLETAVMMDTFRPLKLTNYAKEMNDPKYYLSWNESETIELINEGQ